MKKGLGKKKLTLIQDCEAMFKTTDAHFVHIPLSLLWGKYT